MTSTFTVVQSNLEHDGGEARNSADWEGAHHLYAGLTPDILLRQECNYSYQRGRQRFYASEKILGMRGFLGPTMADDPGGSHPLAAVYINQNTVDPIQEWSNRFEWRIPPANLVVHFLGIPVPVCVASFHLHYAIPAKREIEAGWLSTLADKPGHHTLIGGDCNSYTEFDGAPAETAFRLDHNEIPDRPHVAHRFRPNERGDLVPDTLPDRILTTAGLVDAARHVAHRDMKPGALEATAGHARDDQGPHRRIDRVYTDAALAEAIEDFEVVKNPFSDHHVTVTRFHRARLQDVLRHTLEHPEEQRIGARPSARLMSRMRLPAESF